MINHTRFAGWISFLLGAALLFNPILAMAEDLPEIPADISLAEESPQNSLPEHTPNQILVVYKKGHAAPDSISEDMDVQTAECIGETEGQPIYLLETPEDTPLEEALDEIKQDPDVLHAQPNYIYYLPNTDNPQSADEEELAEESVSTAAVANDPQINYQWHLKRVNAFAAWDHVQPGGNVKIAILDSGIDMNHPDLVYNIDKENAWDMYDDAPLTKDMGGHGTHVAGIISATANNGIGIAGISNNIPVVPINVINTNPPLFNGEPVYTTNTEVVIKAMERAIRIPDVRVINMSLGSYNDDQLFHEAIQRANDLGIICVCAAGNDNASKKHFPSDYDECVAVTATDEFNRKSMSSNYNEFKDIAAPGTNIYSTVPTSIENGYTKKSGTSMASPMVSATIAMIFSKYPDLTSEEVKQVLYTTANPSSIAGIGHGRVNTEAALIWQTEYLPSAKEVFALYNREHSGVRVTWQAPDVFVPVGYIIKRSVNGGAYNQIAKFAGHNLYEYIDKEVQPGNQYTYTVQTYDSTGKTSIPDRPYSARIWVHQISLDKTSATLHLGAQMQLQAKIQPENAANKNVVYTSKNPAIATVNETGLVTALNPGSTEITATSEDGGLEASCSVTIPSKEEKPAPSISVASLLLDKQNISLEEGKTAVLNCTVLPENASNKSLRWQSSNQAVVTVANGSLAAIKKGEAKITATTMDGSNQVVSCSVIVKPKPYELKLSKNLFTLAKGKQVKITVVPQKGALAPSLIWKSSKPQIASVSKTGVVKGLKNGKTEITASPKDGTGKSAKCTVYVGTIVSKVQLSKSKISLKVKSSATLSAKVFPSSAAYKQVEWKSSNPKTASVNSKGKVTALRKGSVIISAVAKDGSNKTAKCRVTIR